MDRWLISFSLGALLSLFLPLTPSLFYVAFFTVLSLLCFFISKTKWLSALFCGCAWLLWHGASYHTVWQNNGLDKNSVNQKYQQAVAEITSIAAIKNDRVSFIADISSLDNKALKKPIRIRVTWLEPSIVPKQGQLWLLTMKIKPAHGFANPGGFNYLTWLKQQHIHATGFVKNKAVNQLINKGVTWREQLYQKFSQLLPEENSSAIVLALTFGEKSQLSDKQWQVLTHTATNHLMAISGLHLGLVALAGYAWLMLLFKVLPIKRLLPTKHQDTLLQFNVQHLVLFGVFLITLFYAYLAGFSTPTIRALIMLSVFILAKLLSLSLSKSRLLLISLSLIILVAPFSLFSVSFWLSFGAVSLIFLYLWRLPAKPIESSSLAVKCVNYFKHLSVFQVYLILVLLPITASLFYQVSLVAVFANLVAVPWLSFVVVPLVLLALIFTWIFQPLADVFLALSQVTIDIVWWYLSWLSDFSWGQWKIHHDAWLLLSLLILLAVVFFVTHLPIKKAVVICFLIAFSLKISQLNSASIQKDNWYLDVLDVGQGLAIAIRANNKLLLYDTAASYPSGFSVAEAVILPYMRYHGFNEIDLLIISHDDNDHAGGVDVLTEHVPIVNKISNELETGKACLEGDVFQWQMLNLKVLHPKKERADHNDDSCVIKVSDGVRSILLTGDISSRIEQDLVNHVPELLKSDVMLAPHHGSKSSSSLAFIHTVAPEVAIFSAGYLNRWRMPSQQVKDRYQRLQVPTLNTAEQGMISVSFTQGEMKITTYKQDIWPFWFAN
ncbi:DNA internalization-related competence protein ComEC/Rec2 [Thalassotalea marina]|uniref:ComEC family protein n=1 Tax=Thalassotalea marina TaxID=1673741 RepID=A0A919EMH7_9GAMM|nr:DNA internalization-related competence protein ComEC/Rec2 [Thalassotalea marina]GHG03027.1 ComEC family protein [Thalassotalea marina]